MILALWIFLLGAASLLAPFGALASSEQNAKQPTNAQPERPSTDGAGTQTTPDYQDSDAAATIGDAERSALTFRAYDLTVHLQPDDAGISVLARVNVRNDSAETLPQVAIGISSSLHWDGVSQREGADTQKLSINQHTIETDADHTGRVSEAVIRLSKPLQPKASAELTLLYSGSVQRSTSRVGAAADPADWNAITHDMTSLPGFGEVLWYPVASKQVFLGEGANMEHAFAQQRSRQSTASIKLRLSVEYKGEAPALAYSADNSSDWLW